MSTRQELIKLRDDAKNASSYAHKRITANCAIVNNRDQYTPDTMVGRVHTAAGESLMPKTTESINKLKPAMEGNIQEITIAADRSDRTEMDLMYIDDLRNWSEMMEIADGEKDRMRTFIHHNISSGMAISKIYYNRRDGVVVSPALDPTTFSPDPGGNNIDLRDSDYVVHSNDRGVRYVRRHYPEYPTEYAKDDAYYCVDEMWLRKDLADDIGIDCSSVDSPIVVVNLINDDVYKPRPSPLWYPSFPFACWRNMPDYTANGKPQDFWGFGYADLLWPQQKVLDHLLANLMLIANNQAVGRFMSEFDALDVTQVLPLDGLNIQLNPGHTLAEVMHLQPDVIPPVLFQFVVWVIDSMNGLMPSLNPVFSGEAPETDLSGKAINSLQFAAFTQATSNLNAMNEFRVRRKRMQLVCLQQYAEKPVAPHLWRGGIDLPDIFPEDARHIGFNLVLPDSMNLPNTPQMRLELARFLANAGIPLKPEKLVKMLNIDTQFGVTQDDFAPIPIIPQAGA